jgi:hypothetical protein
VVDRDRQAATAVPLDDVRHDRARLGEHEIRQLELLAKPDDAKRLRLLEVMDCDHGTSARRFEGFSSGGAFMVLLFALSRGIDSESLRPISSATAADSLPREA